MVTKTMKRILVVDDDAKTTALVKLYLERNGHRVSCAYDGAEALHLARKERPDLVVLDLMLPGMDGLSVCQALRQESDVPIIMLTARTTEEDRLTGLDLGADDYVTKPFSPRELAARVRAVFRRTGDREIALGPDELTFGDLRIDFRRREAVMKGQTASLSPTEFRLLAVLAREPGRVFSRDDLIEKALGRDFDGFDRTVDVHILNVRRKIEEDPSRPRYIKTAYGAGYKFEAA